MEALIKSLMAVFLVGLVVMAIVFFSIFGLLPAQEVVTVLKGEKDSTSTEPQIIIATTTIIERIIERVAPENRSEERQVIEEENKKEKEEEERVAEPQQETQPNLAPAPPETPQQSAPLEKEQLSEEAIKLDVSSSGFEPKGFTATEGDNILLSVTSVDSQTHVFKFKNEELQAIAIGVAPGETRAINFIAPEAGEYDFFCDVPGHEIRGEKGTMTILKP